MSDIMNICSGAFASIMGHWIYVDSRIKPSGGWTGGKCDTVKENFKALSASPVNLYSCYPMREDCDIDDYDLENYIVLCKPGDLWSTPGSDITVLTDRQEKSLVNKIYRGKTGLVSKFPERDDKCRRQQYIVNWLEDYGYVMRGCVAMSKQDCAFNPQEILQRVTATMKNGEMEIESTKGISVPGANPKKCPSPADWLYERVAEVDYYPNSCNLNESYEEFIKMPPVSKEMTTIPAGTDLTTALSRPNRSTSDNQVLTNYYTSGTPGSNQVLTKYHTSAGIEHRSGVTATAAAASLATTSIPVILLAFFGLALVACLFGFFTYLAIYRRGRSRAAASLGVGSMAGLLSNVSNRASSVNGGGTEQVGDFTHDETVVFERKSTGADSNPKKQYETIEMTSSNNGPPKDSDAKKTTLLSGPEETTFLSSSEDDTAAVASTETAPLIIPEAGHDREHAVGDFTHDEIVVFVQKSKGTEPEEPLLPDVVESEQEEKPASSGFLGSWLFSGNVIKHPSGQGDGTVFQTLYNPRIVQRLTGSLRKISNYLTGSPETQAAANDEEVQASLFEAGQAIEMDELPNGIRQPDEGQGHHRTDLAGAQSD
eukprot:GHVQ01006613.1.p1 GENE.GHVQ01006613.1~~GHVQ01006613.1.p1  ORF type:complete len:598 (+),score=45.41 GHVQ01006613.1:330-2123(+)